MVAEEISINLKKRNIMVFAIVALLIVLVLPTLFRFYAGNSSLIGAESYYHFRAARELLKQGAYNLFDPPDGVPDMSYSPRSYFFSPYHYILVYASSIVSLATASRVVPFLLGVLSFLIFNLILKRFVEEDYKRHVILLLLVLNPAFIYTFTVSNPHSAAIALSLLGFYFFLKEGKHNLVLSVLCFAVVSLFSLFNTLLVILLLLAYVLAKRNMQNRFIVTVFILMMFSLAKRASFYYNYTYAPQANIFGNLFSDLGGMLGFGIFSIVLAVYGVVSNWKSKSKFIYFFIISLLLIVSLFFAGNVSNMYLMFFVAAAAGIGFVKLYEQKWNVLAVKNISVLILVCGLLFSTASYLTRPGLLEPEKEVFESLEWLGSNTFKDGFVLSHYDNGYLISGIARNPVLTDSFSTSDYDQRFFYKVQDSMFYSRKIQTTKQLFGVYNIKYVYITPEMKSGKVWSRPDEGLLFLFTSNSTFKNVYDKDGIEIWEVINTTVE
ncbi:MAG: hypothetical protein KKD17_01910 [Nanoarchaeota archaeon]|nr:hypothetical protein [Nanoarchaeota archaeon]